MSRPANLPMPNIQESGIIDLAIAPRKRERGGDQMRLAVTAFVVLRCWVGAVGNGPV